MTLSTLEVANIAQVSLRQMQWWDEKRVVQPRHEGHRRIYNLREALDIAIIAELRRRGLSLQQIRRTLRQMRSELSECVADHGDRLVAVSELWLIITEQMRGAIVVKSCAEVIEVLKARPSAAHVISLSDILGAVNGRKPVATLRRVGR